MDRLEKSPNCKNGSSFLFKAQAGESLRSVDKVNVNEGIYISSFNEPPNVPGCDMVGVYPAGHLYPQHTMNASVGADQ